MAAIRLTPLPQNVNLVADSLHLPMPSSPPEFVPHPLYKLTPPNRQALRPLRLPALLARGILNLVVAIGLPLPWARGIIPLA